MSAALELGAPRPDGRWGGRVTARALPAEDPTVRALRHDERALLSSLWRAQAATEHRVAGSFAVVHRALVALEADAGLVSVAARAVDDEHRHAALCLALAGRYAGRACAPPAALPLVFPAHATAETPRLRAVLWVVGQCVCNETFAAAYLEAARDRAEGPLARAALRELLSDEIDHARVGWALLRTLDAATRAQLEPWLVPLAVANLREWRRVKAPAGARSAALLEAHGVPRAETVEAALRGALRGLVLPGLAASGLRVDALAAWEARGAPTV